MNIFKRYNLIFYHLIFWVVYMSLYALVEYASIPDIYFFSLPDVFFTQLPSIIVVYLSIYVFSKCTIPTKSIALIIGIILIFIIDNAICYVISYEIRPHIKANGPASPPYEIVENLLGVGLHMTGYCIFGFAYAFAVKMTKHKKRLHQLEKEKLEAEYAFLRAQINPHFLNNTLNCFYAKSLPLSDELSDGIMTLSQIMRYSLEKSENNRMVLLSDELEHVRNVVKMNQMRFSNRLQIELKFEEALSSVQIVPLIIITIVENILKHGDCTQPESPAQVHLFISEDGDFIHLNTRNKKSDWVAEHSSGIGIENIKKRIHQHYEDGYELTIDDNDVSYSLQLKVPVFHKVKFYNSPDNPGRSQIQLDMTKLFAKNKLNPS